MKMPVKTFYRLKPIIPRSLQIFLRRMIVRRSLPRYRNVWPINPVAGVHPDGWSGWPEGKRFALVLTHDVDTQSGHDRCRNLLSMEKGLGFLSSFNFVPRRYNVSPELRDFIVCSGFEVGVHGLYHDGKYFDSREEFIQRAKAINEYIKSWGAAGYRNPSMDRDFDLLLDLDILYDLSSFDTDPFEPNPIGMGTIFPFYYASDNSNGRGYVELPYTLPQDFTVFILLKEKTIDIWKKKLDWIVEKGGMALVNVHPDYMNFGIKKSGPEEYPAKYYEYFLNYVNNEYKSQYWHVLPKDMAKYWKEKYVHIRKHILVD